jgi:hypothetical protein
MTRRKNSVNCRRCLLSLWYLTIYIPVVTTYTTSFHAQKFYILPTQYICFVRISEQTAIISINCCARGLKSRQDNTGSVSITLTFRRVRVTTVAVEKQCDIFLCVLCVGVDAQARAFAWPRVALLIQHATRVRYIVWPLWLHHIFRHYLINGMIFGKTLPNIKCVFWFSLRLWFEKFLILRINQRDIVINVATSSCKVPVIIVGFEWTLNFLDTFSKTDYI